MEKVIEELKYFSPKFPRKALEKAIDNQEEMIQMLLEEFDHMVAHPEIITEDDDYMLHFYSLYLLAQFKEKAAFSKICELISVSSEQADVMFGDVITEDLSSILYSTFDDDIKRLKSIIENPHVDLFIRGAVLEVYGKLYSDGVISKEEMTSFLRELLFTHSFDKESDLATIIQGVIVDRHLFEMIDDVQRLYDEERIDEMMFGKYDSFIDSMYSYSYDREKVAYIEDIIQELHGWPMFEQSEKEQLASENRIIELEKELKKSEQAKRKKTKVGRNDPCPCGSGKKYKKCCLQKEDRLRKKNQEPLEEQRKWLEYYPAIEGKREENEVRLTDHFDEEAIEIDRLVYLALHHRAIPLWQERDREKEEKTMVSYLIDAFNLFKQKCEREDIESFEEYDSQYKIHYRSKEWIEKLDKLVEGKDLLPEQQESIKGLAETIEEFGNGA